MGGALHRATRVFRMYNIENRVDKVLSKEKPQPAPRFPIDEKQTQSDSNAESNVAPGTIHKKNEQLLGHLQDVKVYSSGDNPVIRRTVEASRQPNALPSLDRFAEPLDDNTPDGAFGYVEPQRIPPGRVSLRQFFAYLQQHRDSPQEYSIDRFADMYTIKPEVAQKLFKYHNLLALQEFTRRQSEAPDRTPHVAAAEVFSIEAKARRRPDAGSGFTSKF